MHFLKISGLVLGTGSVVGGTSAGIYYVVNNENLKKEKSNTEGDQKVQFTGKLVFEKKSGSGNDANYEIKLLISEEYNTTASTFDKTAIEGSKYADVNKIIDILHSLNVKNTKDQLNNIFGSQTKFEEIKSKILAKEIELKKLFNDEIYKNLKNKFEDSNG